VFIIGGITGSWGLLIIIGIFIIFVIKFSKDDDEEEKIADRIVKDQDVCMDKEETERMGTTEFGYVNKNNQRNNGKTDIPGTDYGQWFYDMECLECGHKYHANGSNIYEKKCPNCQGSSKSKRTATSGKSTETGYVNKNKQRNNGKTNIPGTGNGQWFYDMECLACGHKYHANGHDVWLRKCPNCQGGRP
jgi:hypothetical protein